MEGCPYCDELKGYLQTNGITYKAVDIDIQEKLWDKVKKITGVEYVPTVMVVNNDSGSPKFFAPRQRF